MRVLLLVSMGVILSAFSFGQSTKLDTLAEKQTLAPPQQGPASRKEFSIGIDLLKNIPFLLLGDWPGLITEGGLRDKLVFELSFRKKLDKYHNWVGLLGYAQGDIQYNRGFRERSQFFGLYGKGGKEYSVFSENHGNVGLLAIITYGRYHTDLRYKSPTFGDYTETREIVNVGIGAEPYFAYDFFPDSRWVLRWITRLSFHYRFGGEGSTPYYPGIGNIVGGYNLIFSGGTTLQLHYRFQR